MYQKKLLALMVPTICLIAVIILVGRCADSVKSTHVHSFREPWLMALAGAYQHVSVSPEEFRQCYVAFFSTKVWNLDVESDGWPEVTLSEVNRTFVPQIKRCPWRKRLNLFRAHCLYPKIVATSNRVFDLVEKEFLDAGLTVPDLAEVRGLQQKLTTCDAQLKDLRLFEYISAEFVNSIEAGHADCDLILAGQHVSPSARFIEVILPNIAERGWPALGPVLERIELSPHAQREALKIKEEWLAKNRGPASKSE